MRILIVEDDPSIHRIISRRLKEEGYVVDDCYDGEEGLHCQKKILFFFLQNVV